MGGSASRACPTRRCYADRGRRPRHHGNIVASNPFGHQLGSAAASYTSPTRSDRMSCYRVPRGPSGCPVDGLSHGPIFRYGRRPPSNALILIADPRLTGVALLANGAVGVIAPPRRGQSGLHGSRRRPTGGKRRSRRRARARARGCREGRPGQPPWRRWPPAAASRLAGTLSR
jgi:hypothetical protein